MVGLRFLLASNGSGMVSGASLASNWMAPAGLRVCTHSNLNRFSKKWLLHCVGVWVQTTSRPEVMASAPAPLPWLLAQPRPMDSIVAASGSAPTWLAALAPWVLPRV